jgi:cyanophycinase
MVMCQFYFDPSRGKVEPGLNLIANALVLPHHNNFGKNWATRLLTQIPNVILIGIDEGTGMLSENNAEPWRVLGQGAVTIYHYGRREIYPSGSSFSL